MGKKTAPGAGGYFNHHWLKQVVKITTSVKGTKIVGGEIEGEDMGACTCNIILCQGKNVLVAKETGDG